MAYIKKIKEGTETIYPATIPQAVVDPTSGKSVRTELDEKAASADLVQLAGEVSLLDAVHSDKIKNIENVISTMNPNQSAQLSVSGVSPLSLPKNAANSGMSVKLEGLTEDVGGVITHFVPTGRVRSMGKNIVREQALQSGVGRNLSVAYTWDMVSIARSIDFIEISPNTTYRISGLNLNRLRIAYYDKDYVLISGIDYGVATYTTRTFGPTPSNANYMRSTIAVRAEPSNVMIEKDTGVTSSYEPYRDTKLYLTAPELRSNGTVKDEIRKGANGYELVKRINDIDGTVLATPVISPISYGGVLNSAENGTVSHEPVIADAGVYDTKIDVLLTDYPISVIEEVIKYENGINTYLDVNKAVIAGDKLSFTHPDLTDGDLVLFTYAYSKESTNGNITATFYDSNVVKIDTATGKAYKIEDVITDGVLTRTLTEV